MKTLVFHSPLADSRVNDAVRYGNMGSALQKAGIDIIYFPIHSLDSLKSLIQVESPDIVFCTIHHLQDTHLNPINTHAYLEKIGIPYIGSSAETLELVLSKSALKNKWQNNYVATPEYYLVQNKDKQDNFSMRLENAVNFPYILKPNLEGNSRGLGIDSIVLDRKTMISKANDLLQSFSEVLVEKYLGIAQDIREFTVAMIGNGKDRLLMPAEITLKQNKTVRIITTEDKENHNTLAVPVIEPDLKTRLNEFSLRAFEVAGVQDYARCDILMTENQLYALEINGQPMIPDRWFEMAASGAGLNAEQYLAAIFLAGIERNLRKGVGHLSLPEKMENFLPEEIFKQLTGNQIAFNEGISLINLTGQS
jgi:D-alanine-D-alanine ligase